jgi:hypothetical protein
MSTGEAKDGTRELQGAPHDALVYTCRQIRKLLGSAKPSPALRIAAPHVADALPLVQALVLGIEDLADRTTLIEARLRPR